MQWQVWTAFVSLERAGGLKLSKFMSPGKALRPSDRLADFGFRFITGHHARNSLVACLLQGP